MKKLKKVENQLSLLDINSNYSVVVDSTNNHESLNEIFEDFNLIRFEIIDNQHYFVLNDFAEHVVKSINPSKYIYKLKKDLKSKGFEVSTVSRKLKITANNNKIYDFEAINGSTLLRICQEVNSVRFEPLRQWLAGLGWRELNELKNPELTINRGYDNLTKKFKKEGKSEDWIVPRLEGIPVRKSYTSAILESCPEAKSKIGILTNIVQQPILGMATAEYKLINKIKPKDTVRNHLDSNSLIALNAVENMAINRMKKENHNTYNKHLNTANIMANSIAQIKNILDLGLNM